MALKVLFGKFFTFCKFSIQWNLAKAFHHTPVWKSLFQTVFFQSLQDWWCLTHRSSSSVNSNIFKVLFKTSKRSSSIGRSHYLTYSWIPNILFFITRRNKGKVIYPKYSKHWLSTVAHTIDCVCSKILNHCLNHG